MHAGMRCVGQTAVGEEEVILPQARRLALLTGVVWKVQKFTSRNTASWFTHKLHRVGVAAEF